jgi:polar amino acid transport system substrate-binding protein
VHRWLLGCALLIALHATCAAQSTIRLARIADVPDQLVGGEILRTIYARLGIALEMIDVSSARGLALSSAGLVDGEVHRVAGVAHDHPSLIRISPSINYIEPSAFVSTLEFAVNGWDSLHPYTVGIVRGVGSSEAGVVGLPSVVRATDLETLMRMLNVGRLDLVVFDRFSGDVVLRKLRLHGRIRPLSPPLQRIDIYHYLHETHRDLASRVQLTIAAMQAASELTRLRQALVERVLAEALR